MSETTHHQDVPILQAGTPLRAARGALLLLHGRGASATGMLALGRQISAPGLALLAPQAANNTWYPQRFSAPTAANEPWLTSALDLVAACLGLIQDAGIAVEQTLLLGFSQGGCLALEAAARRPQRYGGVVGLSAALIENGDQPRMYGGDLAGVPVLLGCSDADPHIPLPRVTRTAELYAELGAQVDLRIYPGTEHSVNQDEIAAVQRLIEQALSAGPFTAA